MGLRRFEIGSIVSHSSFGKGVVVAISKPYIGVEFRKASPCFGTLGGKAKNHHGVWCFPNSLYILSKKITWD